SNRGSISRCVKSATRICGPPAQTLSECPEMRAHVKTEHGFTLLEALVVLVLTSLVSMVLVQGFGLLLGARASVQDKLVGIDEAVLEQSLFLEPLRGVVPDYPDRPHVFAGDAQRL